MTGKVSSQTANNARHVLQYAFNLFSHNSPMTENGYNEEEMKMVKETKKIWGDNDVNITATCIRVPIMRAHAESINLEFDRDVSEEEVGFRIMAKLAVVRAESQSLKLSGGCEARFCLQTVTTCCNNDPQSARCHASS